MLRLLFILAFLPISSFAFVRTMSDTGHPLYWTNLSIALRGNPTNSSGLSNADLASALNQSATAWNNAGAGAGLTFDLSNSYPAHSGYDGVNAVYFSTAANRQLDWGVVALTEVLYYLGSGQMVEADVVFNDSQFLFTNHAGDTGTVIGSKNAIYLADVATHEFGHVLGLDHSTVNLSSMIYTAFNGQFALSNDDKAGVVSSYANNGSLGSISGNVRGTNGGIFGAHVQAINLSSGQVQSATLAQSDGSFRISALPPGEYAILTEPLGTGSSTISSYYQTVDHHFCNTDLFRRTFYRSCTADGKASAITISAGSSLSVGTISPSCAAMGSPVSSSSIAAPVDITTGARYGTLTAGSSHFYRLRNFTGKLLADVTAFSIYSPMDYQLSLLNPDGSAVAGVIASDNVVTAGGNTNYDPSLQISGLSGDYILKVTAVSRLFANKFSAGYDLLDSSAHYLLSTVQNDTFNTTQISDMSACVSVNNISQAASFGAAPAETTERQVGGCGSIGIHDDKGPPWNNGILQMMGLVVLFHFLISQRKNLQKKHIRRH